VGCITQMGGNSQEEEYYNTFKNGEITSIEYQMENRPLGYVLLKNTEDAIKYYRDICLNLFPRTPEKILQIRDNDIRQTWSKYEAWINENNKTAREQIAVRRAKVAEFNILYDEGKLDAKYIPFRLDDFTKEQQNKLISSIIGNRAIFKREWDLILSSMERDRARSDWYNNTDDINSDSSKTKFKNILYWLVLREALWYFGYINRFIDQMEYAINLGNIETQRKSLIVNFEVSKYLAQQSSGLGL